MELTSVYWLLRSSISFADPRFIFFYGICTMFVLQGWLPARK